jgi:hypothetical protein
MSTKYQVIIPEWESFYVKSQKTAIKYWLFKDKEKLPLKYKKDLREDPLILRGKAYCCDSTGERFIKNTKKAGKPNIWILNGQDLYNAMLNWRLRKTVAKYFHEYFAGYIEKQLKPIEIPTGKHLSISCDIYEIKRGNMPDVSNMWLLEKFFEDALQECKIIPEDSPDYVIESGRKRYRWVKDPKKRKLIFTIKII